MCYRRSRRSFHNYLARRGVTALRPPTSGTLTLVTLSRRSQNLDTPHDNVKKPQRWRQILDISQLPTGQGPLKQTVRQLRRRLWGSASTGFFYDYFLAFLASAGDIFGVRQRHFLVRRRHVWAPPATFLGSAGDIFCPAGDIFGTRR